ncbi:MAG: stage V sporulation protein AD [Lachnospiraceae bacterium]|nr:stage V sporulation protein AD [Lachnospiraceae bacterium]
MQIGKASIAFDHPPVIIGRGNVVGKKEGDGPLGNLFDRIEEDAMFGMDSWEEAESRLQKEAAGRAIESAGLKTVDIRYLLAGDLLGQLIATSFGVMELEIPMFGLYGACSTMGEAMTLGSILVDGGYADRTVALASSHFASAEKQFRFPLEYGNQRPLSTTWTVTGSGAVVLAREGKGPRITGVTPGKIVDMGLKDSMNMGACMAPSAADTLCRHMQDFGRKPEDYDRIITGDLGNVGKLILEEFMTERGMDIHGQHMDCGIEIFDDSSQDTHSGGSGCGCSAVVLTSYVLPKLESGEWKRVLFVPTGALLSTVSFNEGQSVPGIAHALVIEA